MSTRPYIVTTKRRKMAVMFPPRMDVVYRRAVATLEEREVTPKLREMLPHEHPARLIAIAAEIARMPESGGTIGPLPDGTMIEVEQTNWLRLAEAAGIEEAHAYSLAEAATAGAEDAQREILDAYNARQV
jgi:hypothetical protein